MSQPISDEQTEQVMAGGEQVLDVLIDTYKRFRAKDSADGARDEFGALGGVQMVAQQAPFNDILLALAIRRLAGREG